jgi:RNA 3'-terminal phosphate cyclase (ATP)
LAKDKQSIYIDGSFGEGGGQILRTSLSLSCITGKSFQIKNIRAARRNPGLAKQHLSCIEAAGKICKATANGAQLSSKELEFQPAAIQGGNFFFDIGSAGSATLVAQTLLPALFLADKPSSITIIGGTHNPMAPPFDFIEKTFLPAIATASFYAECKLTRYGFYPAGGGKINFEIKPKPKDSSVQINLCQEAKEMQITAKVYTAHLPSAITQRQRKLLLASPLAQPDNNLRLTEPLNIAGIELIDVKDSNGPGNCVTIELFDNKSRRTTVFSGFGMRGKRSEEVINEVVSLVTNFLNSDAEVDYFLADQLLVYLAIAGSGQFTTERISTHLETNIEIITKFLPVKFRIESQGDKQQTKAYKVTCHPA